MDNSDQIDYINAYATVNSFGGMAIPVPIQNMILRNYAATKKAQFVLPQVEHKFQDCYMQLFATIRATNQGGHIAICSSAMLPTSKTMFDQARSKILEKRITLHCIFENISVSSEADFNELEDLIRLRNIADFLDKHTDNIKEFLNQYA